jgi:hypothetical protein
MSTFLADALAVRSLRMVTTKTTLLKTGKSPPISMAENYHAASGGRYNLTPQPRNNFMKHYDKFEDPFSTGPIVPKVSMQVVEMPCYHCGRTTRLPVPTTCIDWEKIAESYRKRLEEMRQSYDQMSRDVEVLHVENPAAEYMANQLRFILFELKSTFNDPNRESGS